MVGVCVLGMSVCLCIRVTVCVRVCTPGVCVWFECLWCGHDYVSVHSCDSLCLCLRAKCVYVPIVCDGGCPVVGCGCEFV